MVYGGIHYPYFIFFLLKNHRLWVLIRTASPRPIIYVLSRNMKNIRIFYLKIFLFVVVKFSIFLNRRVFEKIHWLITVVENLNLNSWFSCNVRNVSSDMCAQQRLKLTSRKHAYSNILKILQPKMKLFQMKISDIFSYSCSEYRLWVHVRTTSAIGF